jgi:uncharacterized membrane protein
LASVLVVALFVAAIYALINLAVFGRLNTVARMLAIRVLELIYFRRIDALPEETDPTSQPRRDTVPMAVPLAIGLIISQAFDVTSRLGVGGGHA